MSNATQNQVSFAGLDDYKPWEGAAHGMVSHEGLYMVDITSVSREQSKSGDKEFFVINQTVVDEDNKGVPLIARAHYYGMGKTKDKKTGTELPYNMAKQTADLAVSAGVFSVEQIQAASKAKQPLPVAAIQAALVGKRAYIKVTFDLDLDGQLTSVVDSYIAPAVYAKLAKETPRALRGTAATSELREQKLAAARAQATGPGLPPSLPAAMPQLTFGNGAANAGAQAPAAAAALPAAFRI